MMEVKAPWLANYGDIPAHLAYFEGTMFELVEAVAQKYPKYIAFDFMGRSTTYAEFVSQVHACAGPILWQVCCHPRQGRAQPSDHRQDWRCSQPRHEGGLCPDPGAEDSEDPGRRAGTLLGRLPASGEKIPQHLPGQTAEDGSGSHSLLRRDDGHDEGHFAQQPEFQRPGGPDYRDKPDVPARG